MTPRHLQDLVADLRRLTPADVEAGAVLEVVSGGVLDEHSLRPFVRFRPDRYQRHLVHRDGLFDVLVLCWQPGHVSPVHNHAGQLGWVRLVRGRMEEEGWRHAGGGPLPDLATLDIDADGVGHGVRLERTGTTHVTEPGSVATVDRVRAIHSLGNPRRHAGDEPAVTLHVYSRPHDSCLVFDPGRGTVWRRQLAFDSVPGG